MTRIYAIKCPQCGSTQQEELKEHYYRCRSCGTEYYRETDDVKINHHHYVHNENNETETRSLFSRFVEIVAVVVGIAIAIGFFFFEDSPVSSVQEVLSEIPSIKEKRWATISNKTFLLDKQGEPILMVAGKYTNKLSGSAEPELTITFINPKTGETYGSQTLPLNMLSSYGIDSRTLLSGETFVVVNKRKLFQVDMEHWRWVPMNDFLATQHSQFAQGIAEVEIRPNYSTHTDDQIRVTTNTGEKFYYYYDSNLIIASDKYSTESIKPVTAYPKDSPVFHNVAFSSEGHYQFKDKDDTPQLIEYWRQTPLGVPYQWFKFFDLIPPHGEKRFMSSEIIKESRVIKWRNVTPERQYIFSKSGFDVIPSVQCYSQDYALIVFKNSILEEESPYLQLLALKDGAIIWTKEMPNMQKQSWYKKQCVVDKQGEVIFWDDSNYSKQKSLYIDRTGQIQKEIAWY